MENPGADRPSSKQHTTVPVIPPPKSTWSPTIATWPSRYFMRFARPLVQEGFDWSTARRRHHSVRCVRSPSRLPEAIALRGRVLIRPVEVVVTAREGMMRPSRWNRVVSKGNRSYWHDSPIYGLARRTRLVWWTLVPCFRLEPIWQRRPSGCWRVLRTIRVGRVDRQRRWALAWNRDN